MKLRDLLYQRILIPRLIQLVKVYFWQDCPTKTFLQHEKLRVISELDTFELDCRLQKF